MSGIASVGPIQKATPHTFFGVTDTATVLSAYAQATLRPGDLRRAIDLQASTVTADNQSNQRLKHQPRVPQHIRYGCQPLKGAKPSAWHAAEYEDA